MSFVSFALSQHLKELSHVLVEGLLELVNHPSIAVLLKGIPKNLRLLINSLLSALHSQGIHDGFLAFFFFIFEEMFALSVKLILSNSSIKSFIGADLLKESLYDTRKEVIILVQSCKDAEQVLIGQETLFEAFIEEIVVSLHDFIDCLDTFASIEQLFL